jgi:hypothetical protein
VSSERIAWLVVALALVASPSISRASTSESGVRGLVTRGPMQPVCPRRALCAAPASNVAMTFVRGSVVRHVRTNLRGRYSIKLAPGTYRVRISTARFGYSPRIVTVRRERVSTLNIRIDTGIR